MNTTANIYRGILAATKTAKHTIPTGRHMWLQMARGTIVANGKTLSAGDGAFTSTAGLVKMKATANAEFLLFDLA
jgi:redox-sensitive bicupin YhaK (pirin superfamily)